MKRSYYRRMFALLLALALGAFALSGCTAQEEPEPSPAPLPEVTETHEEIDGGGETVGFELHTENEPLAATGEYVSPKTFTAKTMDGLTLDSAELLAGYDVTAINIWATWCPPCVGEMPDLAEYAKTLPDSVQLITYCIDGEEAAESAAALMKDSKYEGITLVSADGDFEAFLKQVQYVPTTIFVAENGTMLTDLMIGSPQDFAGTYNEYFNAALRILGRPEME